jgi:hypothetical protein
VENYSSWNIFEVVFKKFYSRINLTPLFVSMSYALRNNLPQGPWMFLIWGSLSEKVDEPKKEKICKMNGFYAV